MMLKKNREKESGSREQQATEMARKLKDLKAAKEALKKINEEQVSKCANLEQQLSEVKEEKETLEGSIFV